MDSDDGTGAGDGGMAVMVARGAGDGGTAVVVAPGAGDGGFAGTMLWYKGFRGSLASHRDHSGFDELCSTHEST